LRGDVGVLVLACMQAAAEKRAAVEELERGSASIFQQVGRTEDVSRIS